MTHHDPSSSHQGGGVKARLREELRHYLFVSAYLYVCIGAIELFKIAVLRDAGIVYLPLGFAAAKALILRLWAGRIAAVEPDARDAKTSLQEWAQARAMPPPAYTELGRDGPDHQPQFTVQVRLENGAAETARAGTKRAAEQAAARALLSRMEQKND